MNTYNTELYHFGVKGMRWGVRRYQNPDGTLTEKGKKRYGLKETSTKRDIKRVYKAQGNVNVKRVASEYENSLLSNKELKNINKELRNIKKEANINYAKAYNKLNPTLKKLNVKTFDYENVRNNGYDINADDPFDHPDRINGKPVKNTPKEVKDFWKSLYSYDKLTYKRRAVEKKIADQYVDRLNKARLKDFAYSGDIEKGKNLLNTYGGFYVGKDGVIRTSDLLNRMNDSYPQEYWRKHQGDDYIFNV